ncbi:hypothetical protein [methanotrophic endosymbiont of Bathymodiolus puteoserpentis (Logatchev)]|jgi:hypothetical protein|uniref:hypothetical protein n=1 Tax=methanotrophic endosymbiont of Bathymodiolus puteoserpentis (Logatchev) TaxID=343235 RepID=UPI0013CB95E2|nr:hypothetical protein [methanotrophic endosymbiont of Bathymodiolus puteoserpentis (Logatchev)]SHE19258.1 hypothetical protein BPUTEOMOX_185 [methanotrophic endosymbiont of Bathymodiolus puteoserpentis (Logatchev)]
MINIEIESPFNKTDTEELNTLLNSATFRTIQGMSEQIPKDDKQLKAESIMTLCDFADSGALVFPNDLVKNAFFTLLAMALDDEIKSGGEL